MDKRYITHLALALLVGVLIGSFGLLGISWTMHKFSGSKDSGASKSAATTATSGEEST